MKVRKGAYKVVKGANKGEEGFVLATVRGAGRRPLPALRDLLALLPALPDPTRGNE